MKEFFGQDLLLSGECAATLYEEVRSLPIIDYHCHLDQRQIASDAKPGNIGQLWLSGDHYKWRAMRMCGVDEYYVTGGADWKEKFFKYAEIMPKLMGNPLYYWSHLELKQVFGINRALNAASAADIYDEANEKLKGISVRKLLSGFNVEFIATTDHPYDDLSCHAQYGGLAVTPTFRPDKILALERSALELLEKAADIKIKTVSDIKSALAARLDYFLSKGCRIADHSFLDFPKSYLSDDGAESVFRTLASASREERDGLLGNLLLFLMREYKKRKITAQLHFSVLRDVNTPMHLRLGCDAGYDVIAPECDLACVIKFLDRLPDAERPAIILYSLNPNAIAPLAGISGAFRNVYIGAAWWFNDTLEGIKRNLSVISEYAVLGTCLGMLTDSRSFSSYSRFDFFRRILCSFVGEKVENGEYCIGDAKTLVKDICYYNAKELLRIYAYGSSENNQAV